MEVTGLALNNARDLEEARKVAARTHSWTVNFCGVIEGSFIPRLGVRLVQQ